MKQSINGRMIALARDASGMTQIALAKELSLDQATISRYESGWTEVPEEHFNALRKCLNRPASFFYWNEKVIPASCLYHRRRAKIPARELTILHAHVNILRIQASRLLRHTMIKSTYEFFRMEMDKLGGPEECARRLRKLWQVPPGPIQSVVNLIESAGGIVFRCTFGTTKVAGISQWSFADPDTTPVFFVSDRSPGDRVRWTLAHEIGHVVMHHLPTTDPEGEADKFAAEFLMPANEIKRDLRNLTLPKASALKSYWKVSMAAIIRCAHRLGQISDNQYEYLFKQMGALGYRLCEPVPIAPEEPALLPEMVSVCRRSSGKTIRQLSEYLGMSEDEFQTSYLMNLTGIRLVG
jgi:Zn-dependent peptidase ImmA (M78 family)/transcriptional regulator with XRE-family HTH domain